MHGNYDFCGWATKNNVLCSDGRTIRKNAFKGNDGQRVPLVWNHQHNDAYNVLGHADLENREEGVYAYCTFNNTEAGNVGREIVKHGDVTALSIYANHLKQIGGDVIHGAIKEVSLVLGGANPQALIDTVVAHSDGGDEEAIISFSDDGIVVAHSDEPQEQTEPEVESEIKDEASTQDEVKEELVEQTDQLEMAHADDGEKTVQDVINTMSKEQQTAMYAIIGEILEEAGVELDSDGSIKQSEIDDVEGEDAMYHNVFEGDAEQTEGVLTHSDMVEIMADAKKGGLLSDAFRAHGVDVDNLQYISHADTYGIKEIETLFPEYRNLNNPPEFIKRDTGWVATVMNGVHKSPFSRIKSMFADLREDEARARGYMKGQLKKEEVFSLLKRTTDPQTVYKKQKLDRDDVIDITDFDVISWIKGEMRIMLNEEIARAILVGDGRLNSSDDKIQENHIRPIWKDEALYNTVVNLTSTDPEALAKEFIKQSVKARKNYKGSGNPTLFTTEDLLADMILLEDNNGKRLYATEEELRSAMRVSSIVTVPVMENVTDESGKRLMGIIVNLKDYNVGADKGGAVAMFDDFDIDYNQMKYLMETRCSGALIKPFSALTFMAPAAGSGANVEG